METMGCKQAPHAVNSGTEIFLDISGSSLGPFNYSYVMHKLIGAEHCDRYTRIFLFQGLYHNEIVKVIK